MSIALKYTYIYFAIEKVKVTAAAIHKECIYICCRLIYESTELNILLNYNYFKVVVAAIIICINNIF